MRSNSLLKFPGRDPVKLEPLEKIARVPRTIKKSGLAFPKNFKAAVVLGPNKEPGYVIFDIRSLWDLLCVFDETYEKHVSTKAYATKNPFGWLIDALESHLPINPKMIRKLKRSLREAEKLGWIPFERLKSKLGLG